MCTASSGYYHDPTYGRFSQADYWEPRWGTAVGMAVFTPFGYAYVQNNPLAFVDPLGHGLWAKTLGSLVRAVTAAHSFFVGAVGVSVGAQLMVAGVVATVRGPRGAGVAMIAAGYGIASTGVKVISNAYCSLTSRTGACAPSSPPWKPW